MKVTALIPDDLVNEVRSMSKAKTTTEALVIVMQEWLASKRLRDLNQKVRDMPLEFRNDFSASQIRDLNRQTT